MPNNLFFAHIADIAKPIIAEHHSHLVGIPIVFRFWEDEKRKAGRVVLGQASKLSSVEKHAYGSLISETSDSDSWCLANDMLESGQLCDGFVISIYYKNWKQWEGKGLDNLMRALLDHELCHCAVEEDEEKDEPALSIVGHDIEEFRAVVERHGDWLGQVGPIEEAKQLRLKLWEQEKAAPATAKK